jgi:rod shape-determining protein MreD
VRRFVLATLAVLAAILLQVTVLNNIPFPGGAPPDLVLVVVVALALASGPLDGAVIGFAAGLAVDIAPPATGLVGQSALVFCLVGYGCGLLRGSLERSAVLPVAGVAAGAAAGEVLYALVGLTFGDPDITLSSVRQVLPAAVFYDVLLSPFVLYAVARLGGYAQWAGSASPSLLTGREPGVAGAGLLAGVAGAAGAVRDTGTGRSPRLRAAAGHRADAWIGGGQASPGRPAGSWTERSRPMRLRGGVAGSAAASPASQAHPGRLLPSVNLRLGTPRRRDGVIASRRGAAGAATATAFSNGSALGGRLTRPSRLRSASLAGGPSALTQPRGRKQRTARLKLGSRRHKDAVVGGGRLSSGTRPGRSGRGARIGKGVFSGSSANGTGAAAFLARRQPGAPGPLRSGRGTGASPRFRGSSSSLRPAARPHTATPRFRGSSTALGRSTAMRGGAAPRFRRPSTRLRGAGRGLLGKWGSVPGWRPGRRRTVSGKYGGGPR